MRTKKGIYVDKNRSVGTKTEKKLRKSVKRLGVLENNRAVTTTAVTSKKRLKTAKPKAKQGKTVKERNVTT
jgi:hypothetical protein